MLPLLRMKMEEYRHRRAGKILLEHVDISLEKSESVLLLGHSGVGKTTLFNLMLGLTRKFPENFELEWQGRPISSYREARKYRGENFSMVFSNPILVNSLSVKDNLVMFAELRGLGSKEIDNRLKILLNLFRFDPENPCEGLNIADLMYKKVSKLSNGQRDIVALGRALIHKTPILIFDEPFRSFSEAEICVLCECIFSEENDLIEGRSVFCISKRDAVREQKCFDRTLLLRKGGLHEGSTI